MPEGGMGQIEPNVHQSHYDSLAGIWHVKPCRTMVQAVGARYDACRVHLYGRPLPCLDAQYLGTHGKVVET